MFLVSLAIADLLVAIFVMPFAIVNDMQVFNKSDRFFPILSTARVIGGWVTQPASFGSGENLIK